MRKTTLLFLSQIIILGAWSQENRTLISLQNRAYFSQAKKCGVNVSGTAIIFLTGNDKQLNCLKKTVPKLKGGGQKLMWDDASIEVIPGNSPSLNEHVHYLASKEIGLDKWNEKYPLCDGRGVIIGIIDDGVGPDTSGLLTTTDGKRKILKKLSASSYYTFKFNKTLKDDLLPNFNSSMGTLYSGTVHRRKKYQIPVPITKDLSSDVITFKSVVIVDKQGSEKICIDLNINNTIEDEECVGSFSKTGNYLFFDIEKRYSFIAEFSKENETVRLSEGEWKSRDNHGEGVASVLTGHKIANKFNGMAPGARLIDYDLGEGSNIPSEKMYTIGTFLKALDKLGEEGAEVINISYSLFFQSTLSQLLMEEALTKLVKQYNYIITFSAGNNGPGLLSLNRRSIYPYSSLVVGAYVTKELDEYVHGVTGIPEEGRIIYYSSRGPGPDMGTGPTIISPLAALTAANPSTGFSAFSGTSSAAPAMGGMVAALISKIKNINLPVVASSIVNAVRLSAKPISSASYVEQGAGVPNIGRAYEIYKNIISGKQFQDIDIDIRNNRGFGGVQAKGVLIFKDELTDIYQRLVQIKGIPSPIISKTKDMFAELRLEYSHPWIIGPKRLWTAKGRSRFEFGIDNQAVTTEHSKELFGEIKLIDISSNITLAVVPITIIDREKLDRTITRNIKIEAEEGKRIHLDIPLGTTAIKVDYNIVKGPTPNIAFNLFNKNGVKSSSSHWTSELTEGSFILPTSEDGHHQLSLSKYKGSIFSTHLNLRISPVQLELISKGISIASPKIIINNRRKKISGKFFLQATDIKLNSKIINSEDKKTTAKYPTGTIGTVRAVVSPLAKAQNSYLRYTDCHIKLINQNRKVIHQVVNNQVFIGKKLSPQVKEVEINCTTFDMSKEQLMLNVMLKIKNPSIPLGIKTLLPGYNEISFPAPEYINRTDYDLVLNTKIGQFGSFTIGNVSFID